MRTKAEAVFPGWVREILRCPGCEGPISPLDGDPAGTEAVGYSCDRCKETFPMLGGIPRMLLPPMRDAILGGRSLQGDDARKAATAKSFGYEWSRFPEMRAEWERNFLEYLAPRGPEFFQGKRVLDGGCGSGRHALQAARFGAEVVAVDLGPAVEVARHNTAATGAVQVIQSDLYHLPFATESFDFIYSLGVLHHLPDPEGIFRNLIRYLKPGGEIQIYLYWQPEGQPIKGALLSAVSAVRRVTTRIPHSLLHAMSYPAAWAAFAGFVWPYRVLRRIPGLRGMAERFPMRQYAAYPFRVCVNDQFDRFSAPIENRYTRAEVEGWLVRAGLEDVCVSPNYGWIGSGRKPAAAAGG